MKIFPLLIIMLFNLAIIGCGPGKTVKGSIPASTVDDTIVLNDYPDPVVNHYEPSVPEQINIQYIPTIQQQAQIQHRRFIFKQQNPSTTFMNPVTPIHLQLQGGVHVQQRHGRHH